MDELVNDTPMVIDGKSATVNGHDAEIEEKYYSVSEANKLISDYVSKSRENKIEALKRLVLVPQRGINLHRT